ISLRHADLLEIKCMSDIFVRMSSPREAATALRERHNRFGSVSGACQKRFRRRQEKSPHTDQCTVGAGPVRILLVRHQADVNASRRALTASRSPEGDPASPSASLFAAAAAL